MGAIKETLQGLIPELRRNKQSFLKAHGDEVVTNVTWNHVFGGLRGLRCQPCFTSELDPDTGIRYQGIPILEWIKDKPLAYLPERTFLLLLLGKPPEESFLQILNERLCQRKNRYVPGHVWDVIDAMVEGHPMDTFCAAISAMNSESKVNKSSSTPPTELWGEVLDDAIRIISVMPKLVAGIYHAHYHDGTEVVQKDKRNFRNTDLAAELATRLDLKGPSATDMMRLYMTLHADHEAGNVSAHAALLVASALSTPCQAYLAALGGLAGPLHGRANQDTLGLLLAILSTFGAVPEDEPLRALLQSRTDSGLKIPGYGHAVLMTEDPRFVAFSEFAEKHHDDSDLMKLVNAIRKIAPEVLQAKTEKRFANVDAISGALLHGCGFHEYEMYTVMFGASRVIGIMAQLIITSMLMIDMERPKSIYVDRSAGEWVNLVSTDASEAPAE